MGEVCELDLCLLPKTIRDKSMKSTRSIDLRKLVDEAKLIKFHWSVLIWFFVMQVLDDYDLAVAGVAIPSVIEPMNVDAETSGFMASSPLFDSMFGAIWLGALADRSVSAGLSPSACSLRPQGLQRPIHFQCDALSRRARHWRSDPDCGRADSRVATVEGMRLDGHADVLRPTYGAARPQISQYFQAKPC